MFVFKHFWSKIIFLLLLCVAYCALLSVSGSATSCVGKDRHGDCVYYDGSAAHQKILQEALQSLQTNPIDRPTAAGVLDAVLREDDSQPAWKTLIQERLLLNYLRLFILDQHLAQAGTADIEKKLLPPQLTPGLPLALLYGLLLCAVFIFYAAFMTGQLEKGSELRQLSAVFTLNTGVILLLLFSIIFLWSLFRGEYKSIAGFISVFSGVSVVTYWWKKLEAFYKALQR